MGMLQLLLLLLKLAPLLLESLIELLLLMLMMMMGIRRNGGRSLGRWRRCWIGKLHCPARGCVDGGAWGRTRRWWCCCRPLRVQLLLQLSICVVLATQVLPHVTPQSCRRRGLLRREESLLEEQCAQLCDTLLVLGEFQELIAYLIRCAVVIDMRASQLLHIESVGLAPRWLCGGCGAAGAWLLLEEVPFLAAPHHEHVGITSIISIDPGASGRRHVGDGHRGTPCPARPWPRYPWSPAWKKFFGVW